MKLVIVESPTKAKTISKFLGNDYLIKASMGHVIDLPKSKLGVDIEHDFAPDYQMIEDREKIIAELQKSAKTADSIILATDPDREGEAIASHVKDMLSSNLESKSKNSANAKATADKQEVKNKKKTVKDQFLNDDGKFKRIVFHEITKDAIAEALEHPRGIDEHLVDAQTARRVLDRLVGYKLSPLLWQKVRRGLSAGRVQSVALRLIVEREKEIKAFTKEEYWTITALLRKIQNEETEFALIEINGEKIESQKTFRLYDGEYKVSLTSIVNAQQAKAIEDDLKTKIFIVAEVLQKETRRFPQMPYTTSTLQQDASRRFGFSGKRTMSLAQKLYEEGYITYHRTDSVYMATKAVFQIREYVKKNYGDRYIPDKPRFYKTKQKLAQEAHEAIRPTRFNVSEKEVREKLNAQYAKLYDLIWRRTIASQMSDAIVESTTVVVDTKNNSNIIARSVSDAAIPSTTDNEIVSPPIESGVRNDDNFYRFKTTGSVLLFDGFLKINPYGLQDKKLPQFIAQEKLDLQNIFAEKHETPPPPRYNDASLVKSLENAGIGRPSTYATIIYVIESRQYIERDQGRFVPTPVGVAVNDFLVQHFSDIDDIPFTAQMEDELDAIASGKKEWVPVMRNFYSPFEITLEQAKSAQRVKIEVEQTDEKCPLCGNNLVIRTGRFGKFLSCSNFPTCTFKKPFIESTNITCPKCKQGTVVVKKTKKGRKFYGCSRYPACTFATWKLADIKKVT